MSGVVMDASAIMAFLSGDAPELLSRFEDDVIVSEVSLKTLEWLLIRSGGKRLEVLADLERLGLEGVVFGERQLEGVNSVLSAVPSLEFESAVAASLAQSKKAALLTANRAWHGIRLLDLEVQIVGSARAAIPVKPTPNPIAHPVSHPVIASIDGGVSETRV